MSSSDQQAAKDAADAERELIRLWRAWRTVHEMCQDRGYELAEEEVRISLDDFRAQYADSTGHPDRKKMNFSARPTTQMLTKYTPLPPPTGDAAPKPPAIGTIWVEFSSDASIGIKQMRTFVHLVADNHFHTGILVTQAAVTASAAKLAPAALPSVIEFFQESDLLVNITRHELVPRHVLLSPEEKRALLERYRLKESQLPRIQTGDPVAKYLGLRRGQVVKIVRKSETAGRYASYRWAI